MRSENGNVCAGFCGIRARIARGVKDCFLIVFTKMEVHSLDRENAAA